MLKAKPKQNKDLKLGKPRNPRQKPKQKNPAGEPGFTVSRHQQMVGAVPRLQKPKSNCKSDARRLSGGVSPRK